jgi:hypothetical protein
MNYIFIDESGDPGKPFKQNNKGEKIETGASKFYILTALPLTSQEVFSFENKITQVKHKYGFLKEIKSTTISLTMYKTLLEFFNKLNIKIYYRAINKVNYKGKFAVDGNKKLHNVFDEYNLVKTVYFAIKESKFKNTEVVIDRADRRLLDGKFDNFNHYLLKKINTKTIQRVKYITHASSEYIYLMQMSDLVCGAIKECITGKNKDLKKIIKKSLLRKIW